VTDHGCEFVGFRDGWRGPLEADTQPLDVQAVRGILPRGGTILGSSRTNPLSDKATKDGKTGLERIAENLSTLGVDALIAIGGEDTLGVANKLSQAGVVRVVGVPMEAIDRLHTTAESHHRALIVEVMGRNVGWIALHAGLAGGANVILIPEQAFDIEEVCNYVEKRFETRYAPIVVVAEGAHYKESATTVALDEEVDAFGHARYGGIGQFLAAEIERRTGKEARAAVLGHIQRGGTPTAFDRVLATRFGVHAIRAVADGESGVMVALRGTDIVRVPIDDAVRELKRVPLERYAEAEVFFG
jgi:6-phosphofructokinase 1